jgi:hypothetical protein
MSDDPPIPDRVVMVQTKGVARRYIRLTIEHMEKQSSPAGASVAFRPLPPELDLATKIAPNGAEESLGSVGFCIYCGSPTYQLNSDSRPTREHIVPEGLGGTLYLDQASCESCAVRINRFEGNLQGDLFWTPRQQLGIRGKKRKHQVRDHVITAQVSGKEVTVSLPLGEHPAFISLPMLHPPASIIPRQPGAWGVKGLWVSALRPASDHLLQRGLTKYSTPGLDTLKFTQLLAKIAHGFAASRIGVSGFTFERAPIIGRSASHLTPFMLKNLRPHGKQYIVGVFCWWVEGNLQSIRVATRTWNNRHRPRRTCVFSSAYSALCVPRSANLFGGR